MAYLRQCSYVRLFAWLHARRTIVPAGDSSRVFAFERPVRHVHVEAVLPDSTHHVLAGRRHVPRHAVPQVTNRSLNCFGYSNQSLQDVLIPVATFSHPTAIPSFSQIRPFMLRAGLGLPARMRHERLLCANVPELQVLGRGACHQARDCRLPDAELQPGDTVLQARPGATGHHM
jgi:hypothetical protein